MSVLGLLTLPWAVEPGVLDQVHAIYQRHVSQQRADLATIEANLGRPLDNKAPSYQVMPNGVAVLTVSGVMAPRMNMLMQVSGGISTQHLTAQLEAIAADPSARSALIVWDSPGGNVLGVPAARDAMRRLADAKPTASLVQGMMASAAYWVGSAARAVYVEGATDLVGSLGVVQRLSWEPASPTAMELVRGRYKRVSVNGAAPSAEVIAHHEGQLDYLYTLLVDDVAQHRGVSAERVQEDMADGRTFVGRQAIAAGLADGEATISELAQRLSEAPETIGRRGQRRAAAAHQVPGAPAALVLPPHLAALDAPAPAAAAAEAAQPESKAEHAERLQAEASALGISFLEAARRDEARSQARARGAAHFDAWSASDYAMRHGITFEAACRQLGIR
jgi:ClpP class serine protease